MQDIPMDLIVLKGQVICALDELKNFQAKRFQVRFADIAPLKNFFAEPDDYLPAFILRKDPHLVAYLNRCAHIPMEMDWNPGEFLDEDQSWIVCSTHYAIYDIPSGKCVQGPCPVGSGLIPLEIQVDHRNIIFLGKKSS